MSYNPGFIKECFLRFILLLCVYILIIQGHEILVHSTGGNVTGFNTIHGNVEIRAAGDSVKCVNLYMEYYYEIIVI